MTKYISDSRIAITEGRDRSASTWLYVGIVVGAIALLLLLTIAGVIGFLIYRGKPPRG